MKPALHRSLIFWAGLLVITFTCWAWWDSCSYISGFQWNKFSAASAPHRITICQYVGGNFVLIGTRKPVPRSRVAPQPGPFPPPFLVRSHSGRTKTSHPVKESVERMINYFPPGSWALYLPYWLILLAQLLAWSLLLLWRARRLKRSAPSVSNPISSSTPIGDWKIGD